MSKKEFSNVDVSVISKELNTLLIGAKIVNIYEVEDIIILKMGTKKGKQNLIIKKDSRINLTEFSYPIPSYPSQYIMSLRKFLKNRRILSISQYNFDRIIIFELSNIEDEQQPWKFIIELFNKGNFILINEENIVKIAKKYRKFRERDILANREYFFPKSRGIDFLTIKDEFKEIVKNSEAEIVRTIARNINISGKLSEEICFKAGINKKTIGKTLNEQEIQKLYDSFKTLRNKLLFGEINAQIILDEEGNESAVIPFEFEVFKDHKKLKFPTFNEAVDVFFSKLDSQAILTPKDTRINAQIKAQEKILKNQEDYLEELKEKKKVYYEYGDFIYANFQNLEKLLMVIKDAKSKHYHWDEINLKLHDAKKKKLEGSDYFVNLIPATRQLIIKVNDDEVYLNLKISLGENANQIYSRGKKAEKKIQGTLSAIKKTQKNIKQLLLKKEAMVVEVDYLIKKPKKKWFEKFRWFMSSDGFLVIGGRDASSNEILFKKYLDLNDLVFHTNFPGSPLAIIKNPNNEIIPEMTINETADFVASYSRAWKEDWGIVDVFYINPSQISKTPPSGEYLPRGSFMISGKKHFIKNAKIEIAVGLEIVKLEDSLDEQNIIFYPKLIYGPISAIKKQTANEIIIKPSKSGLTKGKLAKEIKAYYLRISDDSMKKWIKLMSVDDIILCLPTGNSELKMKS